MKKVLSIGICILSFSVSAQVKNLRGGIINSRTKRSVPYASIILLKANLATNAEIDGIFDINMPEDPSSDTLVIKRFYYETLKIPVSTYKNGSIIELKEQQTSFPVGPVEKHGNTKLVLNKFDKKAVHYYVGLNKYNYTFNYLQVAQKFNVSAANAMLLNVKILRLRDLSKVDRGYDPRTKFLIHVYDINARSGAPGNELSSQQIIVENRSDEIIEVDLSENNIAIPGKQFFIAIEWLRIDINELETYPFNHPGRTSDFDKEKVQNYKGHIKYHPLIGMSGIKGKELNTWALNFQDQWAPYTYFAPDLTDFAISAEVQY